MYPTSVMEKPGHPIYPLESTAANLGAGISCDFTPRPCPPPTFPLLHNCYEICFQSGNANYGEGYLMYVCMHKGLGTFFKGTLENRFAIFIDSVKFYAHMHRVKIAI